jgi:hypothetical protein
MMWALVAVLAVAMIASFFYIFIWRVRQMERHGRLALPCDETVELPAGEVTVFYEDAVRWRHSERPEIGAGFRVRVSAEDGEVLDLGEPLDEPPVKTSKRNRIPYARVEVPAAGRYRVRGEVGAGVHDPAVLLGRG